MLICYVSKKKSMKSVYVNDPCGKVVSMSTNKAAPNQPYQQLNNQTDFKYVYGFMHTLSMGNCGLLQLSTENDMKI